MYRFPLQNAAPAETAAANTNVSQHAAYMTNLFDAVRMSDMHTDDIVRLSVKERYLLDFGNWDRDYTRADGKVKMILVATHRFPFERLWSFRRRRQPRQ